MKLRKIILTMEGQKKYTALGNTMPKYATKRRGSIAPSDLINTRNYITVMGFPGLIQRGRIDSWNNNIVWNKNSVDCFVYLPSILYFTC